MATRQDQLSAVLAALSDPTRRAVVERLTAGPASVSDLSSPFGMAGPSFLKHLKVLEEAGIAESEKRGRVRLVRLRSEALQWVEDWSRTHRRQLERRLDNLGDFLKKSNN
ncbi:MULTISPECIES: ArsR/SmtB family transcription factor [unclassified Mesorhizobium]|uniref:ArsR/SmtB family transcription factor n=1 Tax=unclassified Mesorhizobium TaxID=325217 RepID=UPI001CCB169B|nr:MULTISPECIES: metalloregulator ArsR/SmtB family transcription factor [unclassified Mesorhizobium]MBZ9683561.1 metalloregulator ArsR/SmtB family transcription factor [Mesorhizobium sp. CO1-1-2]MBZ9698554.1 metalloregulator ArsR/SmtB family transcription factor [Mesorhizobium sp. CO1-1-9]MBZ9928070.1 metalloregulator ArsR/SmtB family transcription factor [Mesorhizobium sp. BR1-1-4]